MSTREYSKMAHGGSDVINAQTMKLLIRDSGLNPPIGASPGEMRLWIKQNGLDEALAVKRAGGEPAVKAAAPAKPKKTAGHRGGRAGRSGGSVQAAVRVARGEPAANGPDGSLMDAGQMAPQHDAIDEFKKAAYSQQPFAQNPYAAGFGLVPGVPGAANGGADAMSRAHVNVPRPPAAAATGAAAATASDPNAYARLFQMQVQMQQAALLAQQQQWQMRNRLPGSGVPPMMNVGMSAAAAPYYNLMPQAYNYQQPMAYNYAQQ